MWWIEFSRGVVAMVIGWCIFLLVILHDVVSPDSSTSASTKASPTKKHRTAIRQLLSAAKDATLELERNHMERSRNDNVLSQQHYGA
jgi:hypothetical protein